VRPDAAQAAAFAADGWCRVPGLVAPADLVALGPALARLFPSAEQMAAGDLAGGPWADWDAAWPEFPFHSRTLNRIALGEATLDLAAGLLGTEDLRCYLALATAKYPGQPSGYNRLLHADYPNHTLVVPRDEVGYQHLECLVYLCDVDETNGATAFVSRRRTAGIGVEEHTLNLTDHAELYDASVRVPGPAGTAVCYRPDTYHRSVDDMAPGTARFLLHLAFRPAAAEWGGYQAWPFKGFSPAWHAFVASASPRQLTALGFPAPGHPYWTAQTLAGVQARYPDLDLSPWRAAAGR
jgi:hypothetical protein